MRHRFAGMLVLSFLVSISLFAQNARETVTIEVVDVPVFVTRGAQPVQGLTVEDFKLYVNGKPQPIEYFDVVDSGARAEDPSAPLTLRERRLFLLMFDVAFSNPHAIGRAQRAAAELIARAPASDLFAIATFSSRRGVWFATPFTVDRPALARGIASLSASKSGDPLSIVLTQPERDMLDEWAMEDPERVDSFPSSDPLMQQLTGEALRDIQSMQMQRAIEHQLLDFTDLAARLTMLQGQKHVILLSQGLEFLPRKQVYTDVRRISSGAGDPPSPFNMGAAGILRCFEDMQRAFQGADILLHTLDLTGVSSLLGLDSLQMLASDSGKYMHNRNDFGNTLVALSNSYSHGYLLGFKPVNAKRGFNKIEVRMKGVPRGTTVRHRKGFSGTSRPHDLKDGLYLADVILNDVPQSGTAAALELREGRLDVKVPLRPLSAQLGREGQAELLVYVFDATGEAIDFHRRTINVPADGTGETSFEIDVPAQAHVAKALLRVNDSLGFSKTRI